jgi:membrane-associated phospholipid phosphatase
MRRKILSLLIGALLMASSQSHAGWVEDAESPVTTNAKWILLAGTGLTVAVIATQDSLSGPWERWTAEHEPLGKYSKYGKAMGEMIPNALYVGGMWLGSYLGNEKAFGRAWMMAEATLYASLLGQIFKMEISEGRPYYSETGSSFPSGHSLTAFSFAGVVAAEHGWWYGAPAMALATFVGYSRINDNQHRVHDVVAGATIGLTCAYGIYYSHHAAEKGEPVVRLMPALIPGGEEIVAMWSF